MARTASILDERLIGRQLDVQQQYANEEIGPALRVDEHGVLAEPTKSGALRQVALQNGTGVDVRARAQVPIGSLT